MRGRATVLSVTLILSALAALPQVAGAATVPLPGDAAPGPNQNDPIYQLACPGPGACVAVGAYTDDNSGHHNQALIETQTAGVWAAGSIPDSSLPDAGGSVPPVPYLTTVACTAVASCVAADAYDDQNGYEQGLIATDTAGSWTPSELSLAGVAPVAVNPGAELYDVACPQALSCVGIGVYDAPNSVYTAGMIATQSAAGWSTSPLPEAPNWTNQSYPSLSDVECASAGNCAAVGDYTDSNGYQQGVLESDNDGRWSASELDLSGLTAESDPGALVSAASCPAAGSCSAVGYYYDQATNTYRAFVASQVGGLWQPAAALALPADASTTPAGASLPVQYDLALNGLSCSGVGDCTAVGSYDAGGAVDAEPLVLTESGGRWAQGLAPALPSGGVAPATNPEAMLDSVSCQSAGECLAAGTYVGTAGHNTALLARQTAGAWTTAGVDLASAYDQSPGQNVPVPYWASVACAPGGYCAAGGIVTDSSSGNAAAFLLNAPAAPAAPPTATLAGPQATVSWSPPAADGGLPLTGYTVTAHDLSDPAAGGQTTTASATATSATISGLVAGDSYTFSVSAESLLGTGVAATTAAVGGPPAQPGTTTTTTPAATTPTTTAPAGTAPPATAPPTTPGSVASGTTTTTATATPTQAQLLGSLAGLLKPRGRAATLRSLRRTHRYAFSYRSGEPGRLTVGWYRWHGRGRARRRVLVGAGAVHAGAATTVTLTVRLTAAGRRLIDTRGLRGLTLDAVVSFAGGGLTVTRRHAFTLR